MVKKMFLGAILLVAAISGNAQKAYEGTSFFDNWYLGVNGGGVTPVSHAAFWKNMRGVAGLELGKQVTPVLGISFQGLTAVNTSMSRTAFDALSLSANGKINLNNLFAGYNGEPFGASFNFNLGEEKAWSINIKPAMVYRMDGNKPHMLNVNKAGLELLAGVTYHFSGSNGKHYMTIQRPYDADEVCALNCKINALRDEVAAKNAALDESNAKAAQLQRALADCENAPKQVETVVKNLNSMSLESVVTFRQGRTTIASDQIPNVERIATYMKNHPESKVSIKGYASPEGSAEVNERIAKQRAEAVKNMLINKYKINANRITAEGQGVGNMFSEPDWNRVSIATLNEKEVE